METNIAAQVRQILEQKLGKKIDPDDPLIVTIQGFSLAFELILDIQKNNFQAQFDQFLSALNDSLTRSGSTLKADNKELIKITEKSFSMIAAQYQQKMGEEFLKFQNQLVEAKNHGKKAKNAYQKTVIVIGCASLIWAAILIGHVVKII